MKWRPNVKMKLKMMLILTMFRGSIDDVTGANSPYILLSSFFMKMCLARSPYPDALNSSVVVGSNAAQDAN